MVSWHVAITMPERLVTTAVQRAFLAQPPAPELVVHSDRGGQCGSNAYRTLLHQHGAVRSQSRGGGGYGYTQANVADYFDYHNHGRLHSSIGYQTPYNTHQQLLKTTTLNCPA